MLGLAGVLLVQARNVHWKKCCGTPHLAFGSDNASSRAALVVSCFLEGVDVMLQQG